MSYRLGVDVGGTFTDLLLVHEKSGQTWSAKVPSTPADQSIGVLNGILRVCERAGIDPQIIDHVMHGTTVATNTVLTGTGARVGLVSTKGYRQVLQIARSYVPGGLGGWIITNSYKGAGTTAAAPVMSSGGANLSGYPTTAAVAGTARAFTSTLLKAAAKDVWTEGGKLKMLMVGPFNKTVFSTFSGIATPYRDIAPGKQADIVGAADVFISDFGEIAVVANRFQPEGKRTLPRGGLPIGYYYSSSHISLRSSRITGL